MPNSWPQIAADNNLADGLIAIAVTGTRHRVGVWEGEAVGSDRSVALTVFLACPPARERWGVLRLSADGKTLL